MPMKNLKLEVYSKGYKILYYLLLINEDIEAAQNLVRDVQEYILKGSITLIFEKIKVG